MVFCVYFRECLKLKENIYCSKMLQNSDIIDQQDFLSSMNLKDPKKNENSAILSCLEKKVQFP